MSKILSNKNYMNYYKNKSLTDCYRLLTNFSTSAALTVISTVQFYSTFIFFARKIRLVHIDSTHELFVSTGFHYKEIRTKISTFGQFIDSRFFGQASTLSPTLLLCAL